MEASNGDKLPDSIWEGEVLVDTNNNQWKLGKLIGDGGFGVVYLASSNIHEPVGSHAQYVVKLEPYSNETLSVEISWYRTFARSEIIQEWKKSRMLNHLGLSRYIGSGSHTKKHKVYRFLVLERYGGELFELFAQSKRFPVKTVCYLGIQILDILEYIHSHGYVHADIKSPNLLLGNRKGTENCVYLLDFGLACRYLDENGHHKKYVYNGRRANVGTLEYVSRDVHLGAFSRRGDLETLGYNMLQWLCGRLPWEGEDSKEYNRELKKKFMSNIPLLMRQCFGNSEPPAMLLQYLKYVASLNFETRPSYDYCRNVLRQGIVESGCVDDGELVFEEIPRPRSTGNLCRGNKRRAAEGSESTAELQPKKGICSTPEQPLSSNGMIITSDNPEGETTRHATELIHRLPTIIRAKTKSVVLVQRLPNEGIQIFAAYSPQVSQPTEQSQQSTDALIPSSSYLPAPEAPKITLTYRHEPSYPIVLKIRRISSGAHVLSEWHVVVPPAEGNENILTN
jgi:vaccinia related kinase